MRSILLTGLLLLTAAAPAPGDADIRVTRGGGGGVVDNALTVAPSVQIPPGSARARGFKGTLLCGYCCALPIQPENFVVETIDVCAEAGIDIVGLPLANMYLQNRAAGRTPRWPGVTIVHETRARGLRVAIADDNVRDPFYAYGDHDMLETFTQSVRTAHLDTPIGDWMRTVTDIPAAIMQLPDAGMIRTGTQANLFVLKARSYSELLARLQADRVVIRHGRAIDTTPPDYRLPDPVVGDP